jgi:ATP adenylyltransferase
MALGVLDRLAIGDPTEQCGFCDRLTATPSPASLAWHPVAGNAEFVAVLSLGALVPGWLLVLPRRHVLSLGQLSPQEHQRLDRFVERIRSVWVDEFGPVVCFEHGPAQAQSSVGCSIDHAHLHVVPTAGCALRKGAQRLIPEIQWVAVDGVGDASRDAASHGLSYISLTENGSASIATAHSFPSQVLRRVLATELGREREWNWREHPHLDVVRVGIERSRRARPIALA